MENYTENNKVIAEFVGYVNIVESEEMLYHTDWNWLMGVVEKIESLGNVKDRGAYFENFNPIAVALIASRNKKETVYNACVEFIKWYNIATNENYRLWDNVERMYFHINDVPTQFKTLKEANDFKDNWLHEGNYPDKPHMVIKILKFEGEKFIEEVE